MSTTFGIFFTVIIGFIAIAMLALIVGVTAFIVIAINRSRKGLPVFAAPAAGSDINTTNFTAVTDLMNDLSNPANPASADFPSNPGNQI